MGSLPQKRGKVNATRRRMRGPLARFHWSAGMLGAGLRASRSPIAAARASGSTRWSSFQFRSPVTNVTPADSDHEPDEDALAENLIAAESPRFLSRHPRPDCRRGSQNFFERPDLFGRAPANGRAAVVRQRGQMPGFGGRAAGTGPGGLAHIGRITVRHGRSGSGTWPRSRRRPRRRSPASMRFRERISALPKRSSVRPRCVSRTIGYRSRCARSAFAM